MKNKSKRIIAAVTALSLAGGIVITNGSVSVSETDYVHAEQIEAENYKYEFINAVPTPSSPSTAPSKKPSTPSTPDDSLTPSSPLPSDEPTKAPAAPVSCDLNGDGKTTTTDVKHILKRIVGKIKFSEEQEKAADINGDGAVNTSDALHLLRAIAQISE